MKKIELLFPGLGYKDVNQSLIYVYDKNKKMLFKDKTYNGKIIICLEENNLYIIKANNKYEEIISVLYVKNNEKYIIPFKSSYVCNNSITLLLTDYNYANLPIEKGMITIWQKQ